MSRAPLSPRLEVSGASKSFPGVRALHDVSFRLAAGEVLAVIGENGAGKSTLMKVLAGVSTPDRGTIRVDGEVARIKSVPDALALGVTLIHQELNLADNLDVGANIFLGREPRRLGWIDRGRIEVDARRELDRVGLDVAPTTVTRDLPIGQQQLVEIAKALSCRARVVIMDEPTSSLSRPETERLFTVIHRLRDEGVSVIYISHRLGEVKEVADRVLVLRDGEVAGELGRGEIEHDRMVQLMVGRDISHVYPHRPHPPGDVALEVRELRTAAHPDTPQSFEVRGGEIVALAGLVGAGRTELLQTLFGVDKSHGGTILIGGEPTPIESPMDAIRAGVALVPEDRKQQGLVLEMAVRENLSLASLRRDQRRGFLDFAREKRISLEMIERLHIRTPSDDQPVGLLSGGNQQKVVLGRWLALEPRICLLDEPTRGVDVGAKREIYGLMEELAGNGVAILFASSEMEEVLGMSDRALVMHEGRITGSLDRDELSEQAVMRLATGRIAEPAR